MVQVASRNSVEYLEARRKAVVEVDFGSTVGIYVNTLKDWVGQTGNVAMDVAERNEIIRRISAGLNAMGSVVETI